MPEDGEDVKPAKYPESDNTEHNSVDVLNYILDSSVKSYVDSRDKAPNHDGWLELVDDNGVPIGRIVVQVKKLPDEHIDDPKIQMETRHLSYCYVPIEPFVLIVVDTENEVAFWRHISPDWFEEEGLDESKYKTVSFPQENTIQIDGDEYTEYWKEIIESTRERIENYEEYKQLKKHSNPAIGKQKPHFESIHAFLDKYNDLLRGDFNAVSRGLYPNVWKFGFGCTSYKENSVHYTLYPIKWDENDAQIREIEASWDAVHELGSNRRIGIPHDNPIEREPPTIRI